MIHSIHKNVPKITSNLRAEAGILNPPGSTVPA